MDFQQAAFWIALVLSIFNLWDRIDARVNKAKEPTKQLENRIKNLELLTSTEYAQRFAAYDANFKADLNRIERIEEGNRVTQQALLALLNHAIDGNDIARVKKASDDLTEYLVRR